MPPIVIELDKKLKAGVLLLFSQIATSLSSFELHVDMS